MITYSNRLQDTRVKAWSNTNINKWMKVLSKHGEIILSDTMLNKLNNPDDEAISRDKHISIPKNDLYNKNMYNGKQLDIKFKGKKELYNFYGVKIFPHPYEIVMSQNVCDDGKRARMYRLIYKESEQQEESEQQDSIYETNNNVQEQNLQSELNNKPLNIEFDGLNDLYAFYSTNLFPTPLKIKESRPTINDK
ncbi:hypothetical protein M9Y10_033621 [Tritrichomonas musculus]|uniref:Uncharacterized protein n=1 Tax=Tritrichomonas musculus TaxID=1915356 RepID=A0ABR2KCM8_9EUKA